MALQRLKLKPSEVRKLLRGEAQYAGVRADLERRARKVAAAAGDGMEVTPGVGSVRARANVWTATPEARRREARDRALLRALDAGRQ